MDYGIRVGLPGNGVSRDSTGEARSPLHFATLPDSATTHAMPLVNCQTKEPSQWPLEGERLSE